MADVIYRIVLLVLLLAWSGYFVFRLATGAFDAWKVGRLGHYEQGKTTARVVRSSVRPIEFWFTMTFWHVMLVAFAAVFVLGMCGIWRVVVPS